jgi:hypothetical protein
MHADSIIELLKTNPGSIIEKRDKQFWVVLREPSANNPHPNNTRKFALWRKRNQMAKGAGDGKLKHILGALNDHSSSTGSLEKWTLTIPVISTAHITQEADAYLYNSRTGRFENAVSSWGSGHFLYVEGCGPHEGLDAVLNWALENNHDWIRLDRYGDIVPELPQYEW